MRIPQAHPGFRNIELRFRQRTETGHVRAAPCRLAAAERDVRDAAKSPDGGLSAFELEISGACAVVAVGSTVRAIGEISAILEWAIANRVISGSWIGVVDASVVD